MDETGRQQPLNSPAESALWSLGNGELLSVVPGSGATYMLPLSQLLEMTAEEAIACGYRMPDDPEALDFRVAAILPDKRRDPWYPSLVEDIRIHGLRTPIWIYKDEISDGCHRIAAAQDLGIEYLPCTDVPPDDLEAGVSVFDASTKTWTARGWAPDKRGDL
ncbi:ParB N-terminal domain-containing protein [Streptomyces sp. B21-083]|uniref:ParB N-terminal domain-containing protein n=1 Tax=Streptomyces sp. B21-083 TaxID=3039410 RepID=UPI002FF12640